jgi:hypothetical protein
MASFGDQPVWLPMYKPDPYDAMVFTESGAGGQHYYAMDSVGHVFCIDSPTACIQEAVNYVLSNPTGGKVYIRRGTYNISPNAPLQSWGGVNTLIGINPNPGQTVVIEGDGPDTIINIPTLTNVSGSVFAFMDYTTNCPNNGYQSPRVYYRHLKIVNNNTNTNMIAGGIQRNLGSNDSSPIGPEIEDVEVYNPQSNTFMLGIGLGVAGCSNSSGSYGTVIDKYRFITQNSASSGGTFGLGDLALNIDSVSHVILSNSFLYSSTLNGWFNAAFWNGTGELQIDNTAIYGFKYVFSGAADDALSSYIVSNSVIGLNRFGLQTLDDSAGSVMVNGYNGYLIGGLSANGSTLHVLISNSHIDAYPYISLQSSAPANIFLKIINSEFGTPSHQIWGSFLNQLASGSYVDISLENNFIHTNNGDGVFAIGGNTISGRVVVRNNYLYLYSFSADTGHFAINGWPGIDFTVEDNTVYVGGLNNSGYLGALFYHNGANRFIVRRNRIYLNNGSSSAPYYYALLYGGSSSGPVSWPNWPAVEITDNIIENGTINQLIGLPGSGNNPGYITGNPLAARNYGISAIYPTVSTPAMPSSGTAQSNAYPYPVDVYISGGSATAVQVTRQGSTYTVWSSSTATAIPPLLVRLEPGDSITITYSTAPSWTWVPAKANYGA